MDFLPVSWCDKSADVSEVVVAPFDCFCLTPKYRNIPVFDDLDDFEGDFGSMLLICVTGSNNETSAHPFCAGRRQ
jgi:hypothetical protein